MKRTIRIKEFKPSILRVHVPEDSYIKKSTGLQENIAYMQKTDDQGFLKSYLDLSSNNKVVIIGDSFVETIFVNESKRIHSLVEEKLLKNFYKNIKVYNAGVSGATGINILNTIINKIAFMKPEILIYIQPSCDFTALQFENGYSNNSKFFSNFTPNDSFNEKIFFETIEENSYQILNNIKTINYICKLNNIKLCIATCCSNSSRRQLNIMNNIILKNSHIGYDVIDLDSLYPNKSSEFFYDKQHINEKGCDFLSDILSEYINSTIKSEDHKYTIKKTNLIESKKEINNHLTISHSIGIFKPNKVSVNFTFNSAMGRKESKSIKITAKYKISNEYHSEETFVLPYISGYKMNFSINLKKNILNSIEIKIESEIIDLVLEHCELCVVHSMS
ncbi:SGNH/GDSL hydrolase family protein [Pasteurellaceae bacterium NCTC 11878]|nr:SGNH/GDSL hydrolase family protein [Spirabiliibacterium falconis]